MFFTRSIGVPSFLLRGHMYRLPDVLARSCVCFDEPAALVGARRIEDCNIADVFHLSNRQQ